MTTYGYGKNKGKREVYTKEEADVKYKKRGDFLILTGTMTLEANTDENLNNNIPTFSEKTIDFPEGISSENCVVISYARKGIKCTSYGWSNYIDSLCIYSGIEPIYVSLYPQGDGSSSYENKIRVVAANKSTTNQTMTYEIVLMKHEVLDSEYTLGDVNQDGQITEADGDLVLEYTTGAVALTEQQIKAGDIDKNGTPDALDAAKIKRYANGTIDSLE